jgi:class 3 adenylate cyclase
MGLDIARHLGDVFYGTVGSADRIDFTVIGPAVNEASRIEPLCEQHDRNLLIAEAFARCDQRGRPPDLDRPLRPARCPFRPDRRRGRPESKEWRHKADARRDNLRWHRMPQGSAATFMNIEALDEQPQLLRAAQAEQPSSSMAQ